MSNVDKLSKTCDEERFFFPEIRCNNKAYMKVYWKSKDGNRLWSYLCKYHYYMDRIKNFIFRWRNWYCDLNDNNEENNEEKSRKETLVKMRK